MTRHRGTLRRVMGEPGTPVGRLALAGLLGLTAAAATIGLLAGSGYVVGRAALRPGLDALVGILAAVEVLAFLRGPLRYAERLVGHDAALRALTRWRVRLYDSLTPRVPAALAGWRSGDLLARAIDDVDTLQDLYLRTVLPIAVAVGAAVLGTVVVGLVLPWAAVALGAPLAVALVVPAVLTWRRSGDAALAACAGALSAQVVDALAGASELLAFGADEARIGDIEETGARADALERRHDHLALTASLVTQACLAVAVTAVLALGVAAVHDHLLGQVMVAVLPLAALATFETVPGVAPAVARGLVVRTSAERLEALEAVPVPVHDDPAPAAVPAGVPAISFSGASLRYGAGLPRALDGVTLEVPPGASMAVTGSSGAGKSSLVTALLRYWPLEDGVLTLGGTDVARLRGA
ncbi:MAG TPA: ABC transporter transmembrane domain-containing protein, partial [Acidimicrobiales bacterium]|nr:ABC transporter transmembrane domain-containing protein [Acidimicrobiales bacterium]